MSGKYLAFVLDNKSRELLLKAFPPLFDKVICHHVTIKFNDVHEDDVDQFLDVKEISVVGYISDEYLEALVVKIHDTSKREDGGTYHITLSLDPSKRKPVDSNKLLKSKEYVKVTPVIVTGKIKLENK